MARHARSDGVTTDEDQTPPNNSITLKDNASRGWAKLRIIQHARRRSEPELLPDPGQDEEGSCAIFDAISTLSPYGLAAARLVEWTSGLRSFVGGATVEAELRAAGDHLLAQMIDARRGDKSPLGLFSRWSDAEEAFNDWSEGLREWPYKRRLSEG